MSYLVNLTITDSMQQSAETDWHLKYTRLVGFTAGAIKNMSFTTCTLYQRTTSGTESATYSAAIVELALCLCAHSE